MARLRVVLPGEEASLSSLNVGPGLLALGEGECSLATVTIAGLLRRAPAKVESRSKMWVDYSAKRVSPGDVVFIMLVLQDPTSVFLNLCVQ